ncbi:peptide deformylase [Alicyclobacillus tolerans]|uniref:Peptide deformylase n=2 Tax=Alicyclobacillus tolerans TaxID=90970 RepID=A0ABT9LVY5_9BACL|nr:MULTISPECIES: peptide deformylase [Alicyclobacillus]MDP9728430.1 peptide deformylase [Alicyclobacillus tengchongensis]QRF23780.1 peptide deformylase [Alicyclobacillus sp. TC]SHK16401.1 peptide deformylase [Alicyclobacillus montanus]
MALRVIRTGNDPVLRQVAKPVPVVNEAIRKLLSDMAETMYHAEGIGLAANQIGIAKRIVVMDIGKESGLIEMVNPEIIEKSGTQRSVEGCLSLPGISGEVTRAAYVRVRALNRQGETFEIEAKDLLARCIQHEIDHLDGILFTDYLTSEQIRRDESYASEAQQ